MRQSQGPFGDDLPIEQSESRRLTPSIGLAHDSEKPTDSSNEDFLFHLYRGSELLQDNRVHEAKEELERALHLQPRDSKGQDLLAVVYFRLGLYPRAIQIYEQLRRHNTGDTALLLNLALCYLKTGQPQNARRDLEQLLNLNAGHLRAWGYLGLACERMGDLVQAERAFRQGGHTQMANRLSHRRDAESAPSTDNETMGPSKEVRDVATTAYQELDAGELSFALANPTPDGSPSNRDVEEAAGQSWRPVEPGQVRKTDRVDDVSHAPSQSQSPRNLLEAEHQSKPDTAKPDTKDGPKPESTKDGPSIAPSIPQLGVPQSLNRRPTLIAPVGAPPASEYAALASMPSHLAPNFGQLDDAGSMPGPSLRRAPVVAVPSPFGPPKSHDVPPPYSNESARRTLPPPLNEAQPASVPPQSARPAQLEAAAEAAALRSVSPSTPLGIGPVGDPQRPASIKPTTARTPHAQDQQPVEIEAERASAASSSRDPVRFPAVGAVLHRSGVALVHTTPEIGFAARLESFRAQQSGVKMQLLERHVKGKPNGESFGGVASPMVMTTGEGHLVLAPRPGRKLTAYAVDGEMCFAREDVLLGFGGGLQFENGRLTTGDGEHVPVVQLRGDGVVLLESISEILVLNVRSDRSLAVRREVILGWFGRLVPRAIAASDAPCGQRGLVSFAGDGRVLVTSG